MATSSDLQYVKLNKLKPFPSNPRRMSAEGMHKLRQSIERFGFAAPIVVQKDTNVILAGNQRYKAAKEAGIQEVPVIYLDLDEYEATAYNVADNRLGEEAEWEAGELADILALLAEKRPGVMEALGMDEDEVQRALEIHGDTSFLDDFADGDAPTLGNPQRTDVPEEMRQPEDPGEQALASDGASTKSGNVVLSLSIAPEQREQVLEVLNAQKKEGEALGVTLWRVVCNVDEKGSDADES